MRILIKNTENSFSIENNYYNAKDYKKVLEDFEYEEVFDEKLGVIKSYIEIDSLDDLKELNEVVDHELVLDFRKSSKNFNDEPFIEIYDGWRE